MKGDRIIGEFETPNGRVTVYRRENNVTLFFARSGIALHLGVVQAGDVGKLLIQASETTPYDEAAA